MAPLRKNNSAYIWFGVPEVRKDLRGGNVDFILVTSSAVQVSNEVLNEVVCFVGECDNFGLRKVRNGGA